MTITPIEIGDTCGSARRGTVTTPRGTFQTPCFMPVGTKGAVRTLSSADLEDLGAEVILANTYHLMMRPGADVVAELGGLHRWESWSGHLLTDSGGYQVFSLEPKVDDDGVHFRSTYDGDLVHLTPEGAVAAQEQLGADIAMVLDVCPPAGAARNVVETAVVRTAAWAERCSQARTRADQALFGIVQGGIDGDLRARSAEATLAVGFDGYAVGGLSVGEDRDDMMAVLDRVVPMLPSDQPRYLMGVGDPIGIVEAVARGIDMFDCVLPTRYARHGTILTAAGRINLRNASHLRDDGPLDDDCSCTTCARWSRAYLAHLLRVSEPTAHRLLTIHNVTVLLAIVEQIRQAISAGTLADLRRSIAAVW